MPTATVTSASGDCTPGAIHLVSLKELGRHAGRVGERERNAGEPRRVRRSPVIADRRRDGRSVLAAADGVGARNARRPQQRPADLAGPRHKRQHTPHRVAWGKRRIRLPVPKSSSRPCLDVVNFRWLKGDEASGAEISCRWGCFISRESGCGDPSSVATCTARGDGDRLACSTVFERTMARTRDLTRSHWGCASSLRRKRWL